MKILISGSRKFEDFLVVDQAIKDAEFYFNKEVEDIVHGDAKGADSLASDWARMNIKYEHKYPANWHRYGKKAGMMRNVAMIVRENPDFIIALPSKESIGTRNMIELAQQYSIPYRVIEV